MEEGRLLWRAVEICVRRMEISVTERVIAIEKHERLKYECEKCDDAFTTQNKLKNHEKLKHERVKCACYKCDDAFKTQNKLKNHKKLKPLVIQEGQDWSPTWWCWSLGIETFRKERIGTHPCGVGPFRAPACRTEGIGAQPGGVGASDVATCRKVGIGTQPCRVGASGVPANRKMIAQATILHSLILLHTC